MLVVFRRPNISEIAELNPSAHFCNCLFGRLNVHMGRAIPVFWHALPTIHVGGIIFAAAKHLAPTCAIVMKLVSGVLSASHIPPLLAAGLRSEMIEKKLLREDHCLRDPQLRT